MASMNCLLRRDFVAADLMREHPPELTNKNKQLVFELAMAGPAPEGTISVTRWERAPVPAQLAATDFVVLPGYFDYAGDQTGVWHVNFADPDLFFAYGGGLLAQDELQCAEHPALGPVREALGEATARTEHRGEPTPVLVANVERRITLDTTHGLYGNGFSRADAATIRAAVHPHRPPARSNIIAIAAPIGSGRYTGEQIEYAVDTAFTGFAAAVHEGGTEVRTGFWGCGAFGGNRELMTLVQLLGARLAGMQRLTFYAFDDAGRSDYEAGVRALEAVLAPTLPEILERIEARGYVWGQSNGT